MREGQKRDSARALRRNATDAERIMWRLLRDRRLNGIKFRRQVPVGPFVLRFWNNDVMRNRDGVLWTIADAVDIACRQ